MEKLITNPKADKKFRQANNFIESKFSDFRLLELKTFEFLASLTKKVDIEYVKNKQNKVVSVKLIDLAKVLNFNTNHLYDEIHNIVEKLFKKCAAFKYVEDGKTAYKLRHFIDKVDYRDGIFTFEINHEVLPYFVDIKKEYTEINLKYISALDSIYALRIYKLLKQYTTIESRNFKIKELKDILGIIGYSTYGQLKQSVITPAVEKINLNTDIHVEFSEIKVGKKIEEIDFKISSVPKIKVVK